MRSFNGPGAFDVSPDSPKRQMTSPWGRWAKGTTGVAADIIFVDGRGADEKRERERTTRSPTLTVCIYSQRNGGYIFDRLDGNKNMHM